MRKKRNPSGWRKWNRTIDIYRIRVVLYQLSYSPKPTVYYSLHGVTQPTNDSGPKTCLLEGYGQTSMMRGASILSGFSHYFSTGRNAFYCICTTADARVHKPLAQTKSFGTLCD